MSVTEFNNIPDKVKYNFLNYRRSTGAVIFCVKTALKPHHNIPILWLVMCTDSMVLCSSHKQGVYREIPLSSINSIRIHNNDHSYKTIEVISTELETDDYRIRMPDSMDMKDLAKHLKAAGIEVIG